MIDIDSIAKVLAKKTNHHYDDWHESLIAAIHDQAFSQMTDGEIHQLSQAMLSPEQLNWLIDIFRDSFLMTTEHMPFDFIMSNVQKSAYSLTDWLAALHALWKRAKQNGQPTDLQTLVTYVAHCVQPGGNAMKPSGPLSEVVETMFDKQGMKDAKGAR